MTSAPAKAATWIICLLWGLVPALAALPADASARPAQAAATADLCGGSSCCCADVGGCPCSMEAPVRPAQPERTPVAPRPADDARLLAPVASVHWWAPSAAAINARTACGVGRERCGLLRFVGGEALPAMCIWRT